MKTLEQKAQQFIFNVKQRFANQPSKFTEFAKIVTSLHVEQDHAHLVSKLESFFAGDHPDLLSGLNEFLPRKYEASVVCLDHQGNEFIIPRNQEACVVGLKRKRGEVGKEDDADQPPKKMQCTRKHAWLLHESTPSEVFNKVRDRCVEKNDVEFSVLMEFAKMVLAYYEKKITLSEADMICNKLFKDDPDLYLEANRVLAQSLGEPIRHSEGNSGKGSSAVVCSLQEETMDVKEFYLFEMDLALSRLESTIKKLEKGSESLEDLTAIDFRCVKKLYDDSDDDHQGLGENMVQILKSDPVRGVAAGALVLERLRQKKRQMEEQKLHLDTVWNEIFEDIREKGRVQRHREFLRNAKKASTNGFGLNKYEVIT